MRMSYGYGKYGVKFGYRFTFVFGAVLTQRGVLREANYAGCRAARRWLDDSGDVYGGTSIKLRELRRSEVLP